MLLREAGPVQSILELQMGWIGCHRRIRKGVEGDGSNGQKETPGGGKQRGRHACKGKAADFWKQTMGKDRKRRNQVGACNI